MEAGGRAGGGVVGVEAGGRAGGGVVGVDAGGRAGGGVVGVDAGGRAGGVAGVEGEGVVGVAGGRRDSCGASVSSSSAARRSARRAISSRWVRTSSSMYRSRSSGAASSPSPALPNWNRAVPHRGQYRSMASNWRPQFRQFTALRPGARERPVSWACERAVCSEGLPVLVPWNHRCRRDGRARGTGIRPESGFALAPDSGL